MIWGSELWELTQLSLHKLHMWVHRRAGFWPPKCIKGSFKIIFLSIRKQLTFPIKRRSMFSQQLSPPFKVHSFLWVRCCGKGSFSASSSKWCCKTARSYDRGGLTRQMGVKFDSPAVSLKARLELISWNFGIVYCIEVKLVWNLLRCR